MDMEKIKRHIPKPQGSGRRSTIRMRSDVASVCLDLALQRTTKADLARRLGVNVTTVDRFEKEYLTDELRRLILLEDQKAAREAEEKEINDAQDEIKTGLREIIREQKSILGKFKADDDHTGALMALRDQSSTWERLLKAYTALKEKTHIVVPITSSPEWSRLQAVLYLTFRDHPEAFEAFKALAAKENLRLG